MKKILSIALILLCASFSIAADPATEVFLRFGKQDSVIKVVFEADESFIRNTKTTITALTAKVDFPSTFDLKKAADFPYETVKETRSVTITLKDVLDIRTYRLAAPARIVIEMKVKSSDTAQKSQDGVVTAKPQKESATVSQKSRPENPAQSGQKSPETSKSPEKLLKVGTIVIDPGHGGYDYGIYRQEAREKDVSLRIAQELATILQKKGIKVFLTRKADQALAVGERVTFGNSKSPDLFLSLHATLSERFAVTIATPDEGITEGALKLVKLSSRQSRHVEKSRTSAKALSESLKVAYKTDPALRELPLPLLASLDTAAVLLEYPFGRKSSDQKERDILVSAIVKGLTGNE